MATAPVEGRLLDLLIQWKKSVGQGRELRAEDLCVNCPELVDELRRRIEEVRAMVPVPAIEALKAEFRPPATNRGAPTAGMNVVEGYEILGELGHGGMGVVYRAFDTARNRVVALKTLRRTDPSMLYRFKQEFRALTHVTHPNLVVLHELVSKGQDWFIAMEFVEGVNFLSYVRAIPNSLDIPAADPALAALLPDEGDLPQTEALDPIAPEGQPYDGLGQGPQTRTEHGMSPYQLGRLRQALSQLAEGLIALHDAGLLHRDIKPSNIMVTGRGRVVVLDFGLAVEIEATGLHESSEPRVLGTVAYMSPEQAASLPVSPASDWYSVGVVLYQALTGRLPFAGRSLEVLADKQQYEPLAPRELASGTPEDLSSLCADLLRRDPDARPSGRDVLRRLGRDPAAPGGSVAAQPTPRRSLTLVGREHHLAELNDAFATVAVGSAVALYMHGRSGSGKSALLEHFLELLIEADEAVILAGRCYERESVPYKALDSLIDALSRYLKRLPIAEAQALLPRDLASLVRVFPVLGRAEAVATAPGRTTNAPDPQELRRRAFSALRELLARLGDRQTLVLAIDDLQWGDRDSAALLAEILGPPDPPVLLLLGCYRSEDAERSPFLKHLLGCRADSGHAIDHRELAVEPLTPAESEALAASLLGEEYPSADTHAAAIAREAGGSPFFVIELVRHIQGGDETTSRSALGEDLTLDRVLMDRISRLSDEARRLLEVIAVSGRPLSKVDACQAAGALASDREALAILRSGRLIRGTGPAELDMIESYHDRIRETVVAHLDPTTYGHHHRRLAHVLAASGRADPEALAFHFQVAGDAERAGEYYAAAATAAAGTLAFDRASKLYHLALELLPAVHSDKSRLRINLADALANAGRGYEAALEYLAAAQVAAVSDALDLRRNAATQLLISGHIDEGLAVFDAVLRAVGMRLPTTWRSLQSLFYHQILFRIGGTSFRQREPNDLNIDDIRRMDICWTAASGLGLVDYIRGADFSIRHLRLSLRAGDPRRVAKALAWEAANSSSAGPARRRHAERLFTKAEDVASKLGDSYTDAMIAMTRGAALYLEGRWKSSHASLDRAEELFGNLCTGVVWELDTTRTFSLWCLMQMGHLDKLTERHTSLSRDAQERGDLYALMNFGTHIMSIIRAGEDRPEAARQALQDLNGRWSQRGYHVQHHNALLAGLSLDLYEGEDTPPGA